MYLYAYASAQSTDNIQHFAQAAHFYVPLSNFEGRY